MATEYNKFISMWWIFMLIATLCTVSHNCVDGLHTQDIMKYGPKPKGTIKTIEALEVGDIIDCVDFYKQPAFDNPLIKNIKKMAPRSYPSAFNKTRYPRSKFIQAWNKYGVCPKGTIPIRRTSSTNENVHRKYPNDDPNTREYATVIQYTNKGNGGKALFNAWKPLVDNAREFSLSQMWAVSGDDAHLNSVEAGWMVYPRLFHDDEPRLFIYWTRDGYNTTGCYNLVCRDFVQLDDDPEISLGGALEPISTYDGLSSGVDIDFLRSVEGDWWLRVADRVVGYYPRQLFTTLGDGADSISFGGEIVNLRLGQRHTKTAMGNGQFSRKGYRKACFIGNIQVANERFAWITAHLQIHDVTKPKCYDLTFGPLGTPLELHFFFGGPGRLSRRCE